VRPSGAANQVLTHGPWQRARNRARLLRWAVVAALAGGVVLAVVAGMRWYNRSMLDKDVDHLFGNVLAGGDLNAAYNAADPRFQALCPRERFLDFARRRPALFDREKLTGVGLTWEQARGETVAVLRARAGDGAVEEDVTFYCTRGTFGFRLLGIDPGLTYAVPRDLRPAGERRRP
jgi:hypothetical protein